MLERSASVETDSALEVVIDNPQHPQLATVIPLLSEVRDVLDAVDAFVRTVAVARVFKENAGLQEAARQELMTQELLGLEEGETFAPAKVHLSRVSMASPLTLELIVTGLSSAGAASAVVYLFKNPNKIGEWWPKLQSSWYNGRAEAEKAKQAYEKLRQAGTEMRELER